MEGIIWAIPSCMLRNKAIVSGGCSGLRQRPHTLCRSLSLFLQKLDLHSGRARTEFFLTCQQGVTLGQPSNLG